MRLKERWATIVEQADSPVLRLVGVAAHESALFDSVVKPTSPYSPFIGVEDRLGCAGMKVNSTGARPPSTTYTSLRARYESLSS